MSLSAIERTLQQVQVHQLFNQALHRPRCNAILILDGLVGLVECSSIACKRLDLGIKRLFRNGQALVQPNLSGNPYAFELAVSHIDGVSFRLCGAD
jgi:hypothetical protein